MLQKEIMGMWGLGPDQHSCDRDYPKRHQNQESLEDVYLDLLDDFIQTTR